jgi:glutathione synthase/RimK-type ligase-like ATP-grasp enzyme
MPDLDVVLLTESRYESPDASDWYKQQVLDDDALVAATLGRLGLRTRRVDWARTDFDWATTRAIVFRSTWDYFFRLTQFLAWIDRVAEVALLINPAATVRWNLDKHYLLDLQARGVHTTPTRFLEIGSRVSLRNLIAETGWDEAVLKPTVSGAARHTYRVSAANAAELDPLLQQLLAVEAMMLQPFQRAIPREGELSLMVIGGRYTHAVRKIAKPGDFRVQDDHGGSAHTYTPTAEEIVFAERAVAACVPRPVYARVDIVRDNDGRLAIMELELVEPEMWFRTCPAAAEVMAREVGRVVGGRE